MGNTLLLNSNIYSTCKRITMKKMIIVEEKTKYFFTYLLLYNKQSYLACTYLLQRLTSPILTIASLWYFLGCFPLVFLEDYHSTLFSEEIVIIFLYLDPTTWKASVLPKRVVSSAKTLFQSCFRYSNHFLFFFFSASLYFWASSYALALAILLTFYVACSIWWALATSFR